MSDKRRINATAADTAADSLRESDDDVDDDVGVDDATTTIASNTLGVRTSRVAW